MGCPHCSESLELEVKKDPWRMYQMKEGKLDSQLFHPDQIPDGWHDSPGSAKAATEKKKPGPKPKVKDDNSSGIN